MTNEQLMEISRNKKIDRIIIVTENVHKLTRQLMKYFQLENWNVKRLIQKNGSICYEAILPLAEKMELQIVEPVSGESVYMEFLEKYGHGIMGMRENIAPDQWEERLNECREQGIRIIESEDDDGVWLDVTEKLGGYMCLHSGEEIADNGNVRICQICIVTDDVVRTAHDMSTLLHLGPWEIGKANNETFQNIHCGGYKAGKMPENHFLIGIGWCGSLQIELIEPQSGPIPYFSFLNRRGVGFHHIKQMLPSRKTYIESVRRIEEMGIRPVLAAEFVDMPFCNWDTENMFGFVYEINDPTEMKGLPSGYDPYFVQ